MKHRNSMSQPGNLAVHATRRFTGKVPHLLERGAGFASRRLSLSSWCGSASAISIPTAADVPTTATVSSGVTWTLKIRSNIYYVLHFPLNSRIRKPAKNLLVFLQSKSGCSFYLNTHCNYHYRQKWKTEHGIAILWIYFLKCSCFT